MIDKNNSTFCVIPFVSTMINTDTTVRYCCMPKGQTNIVRQDSGEAYTCRDNFISDAWNSESISSIRRDMLDGKPITGCEICYLQEQSGRKSNRQQANEEWTWRLGEDDINERLWQAAEQSGRLEESIAYLDLRLGNLCNLKCRMCNPWNSSQIFRETHSLIEQDSEFSKVWSKSFGKFPVDIMEEQQWFDSDIMWDQVISLIPKLKKVYMTGGEPTLIKNNFRFMEECIRQGRTDILLFFNTNCTNLNRRFFELISEFKQVNINASVDGTGAVNEYIRSPSNWEQVDANIRRLSSIPTVYLGLTPTVQVYNIYNIPAILDYVRNLQTEYNRSDIFVDLLINVHPYMLNVGILSDTMRQQARKDIDSWLAQWGNTVPELTINSVRGIQGLLQAERRTDWQEQIQDLKTYTLSLDAERSQTYQVLDQRLHELFT